VLKINISHYYSQPTQYTLQVAKLTNLNHCNYGTKITPQLLQTNNQKSPSYKVNMLTLNLTDIPQC